MVLLISPSCFFFSCFLSLLAAQLSARVARSYAASCRARGLHGHNGTGLNKSQSLHTTTSLHSSLSAISQRELCKNDSEQIQRELLDGGQVIHLYIEQQDGRNVDESNAYSVVEGTEECSHRDDVTYSDTLIGPAQAAAVEKRDLLSPSPECNPNNHKNLAQAQKASEYDLVQATVSEYDEVVVSKVKADFSTPQNDNQRTKSNAERGCLTAQYSVPCKNRKKG